jgi:AraC family transcriptional regulator
MLTNSLPLEVAQCRNSDSTTGQPTQRPLPCLNNARSRFGVKGDQQLEPFGTSSANRSADEPVGPVVEICPANVARRRTLAWGGIVAEIVQATSYDKVEYRFHAPVHLLTIYDHAVRREGETFVEGLPPSSLRDLTRKLTFVPAHHEYREWQKARTVTRVIYFYLDPAKIWLPLERGAPRLFFEDAALWDTVLKLTRLIENPVPEDWAYLEALAAVLAQEVVRLDRGVPGIRRRSQGGLAAYQQRLVTAYIEEHLAEQIPLAMLAQLVCLSPYYFCRAFKQSFGLPPHRYHITRRIERAKMLLAKPAISVTDVGLKVGFSDTSSFTAAFRKITGTTPTAYCRSLS